MDISKNSPLFSRGILWHAEEIEDNTFKDRSVTVAPFNTEILDAILPFGGLPFGATHEWLIQDYAPPLSILAYLAHQALKVTGQGERYVLWIGKAWWPTPYLLSSIDPSFKLLSKSLFINPPNDKENLWCIEAALRSDAVGVVIGDSSKITLPTSRRLSLAAKSGGTLGLILRDGKDVRLLTAAQSRWSVSPSLTESWNPTFILTLIKYQGRALEKSWQVELGEEIRFSSLSKGDFANEQISLPRYSVG